MLFSRHEGYGLVGGRFRERVGDVPNPGRGWYRIYTYALGEDAPCDLPPVLYPGETLALVRLDISHYRDMPIGERGLFWVRRILSAFEGAETDVLLRVVYDTAGRGMEREPDAFQRVLGHIRQIGAEILEYAETILVFQGLFVGSWGEMHSSKFLSEKQLREMAETFLEATEGRIRLAFRTPAHLRRIVAEGDNLPEQFGFFDDAMLADETHLGTFGRLPRETAGWEKPWQPPEEIAFLGTAAKRVPFGGEALAGEQLTAGETLDRLAALQVSYLNCVHDPARLDEWRGIALESGETLYDSIGARLGYRLVAEDARIVKKGREYSLEIQIVNRGFAGCAEKLELDLFARGSKCRRLILEPGAIPGGGRLEWKPPLREEWLVPGSPLSLEMRLLKDGRILQFANEGADARLPLGNVTRV